MSAKKITKKEENIEVDDTPMFKEGDYFTAEQGKVKFRGVVVDANWGGYELANSTVGDDTDCDDSDGYSKRLYIGENTKVDLEDAGVTNFKVVKDKRIIKLIETDILPEIMGFRAYKSGKDVKFGCGAVEFTSKEIKIWLDVMTKLKANKDFNKFVSMTVTIIEEAGDYTSFEDVMAIDLDDVKKILN